MGLTAKQSCFIDEYLIDLNATQAAIRAGYSEKTAKQAGYENLKKPAVVEVIAERQNERAKRTEITQDKVLKELARVGFSDIRNVLTGGGAIIDPQDWSDEFAASVSGVELVRRSTGEKDKEDRPVIEHVHKFRLWDKLSALDKIAKHLGMLPNKVELTGADGGPIKTVTHDLTNLSDEELRELERLTDKAGHQPGVGEED